MCKVEITYFVIGRSVMDRGHLPYSNIFYQDIKPWLPFFRLISVTKLVCVDTELLSRVDPS